MKKLIISYVDSGYCRVVYKVEETEIIYCLQDEGENYGGVNLYRCTQEEEPLYKVKLNQSVEIEIPNGEDHLTAMVSKYIEEQAFLIGVQQAS